MADLNLIVHAGRHDRRFTPVSVNLPAQPVTGHLVCEDTGKVTAWQSELRADGGVTGWFIVDTMKAGSTRRYRLDAGAKRPGANRLHMRDDGDARRIDVKVGGKLFTSYHYDRQYARPHFWPVIGPGGAALTRAYTMKQDVEGETKDHPHHRSLWVAHGDVNGADNWSEEQNHGWQAMQGGGQGVRVGGVFGEFDQRIDWQDKDHRKLMEETRHVRIFATPANGRILDLTSTFHTTDGDVTFGDTKEGGLCSVRVATAIDGNKKGQIENSAGGIGEAETWGKPAHWCDYSGPIDGKHVGIAIFDHPLNLRHPTPWHVRDYGLMTANPFGHSHYKSGYLTDGTFVLKAGQSLTFRYRVYLHAGSPARAKLADRWQDFAHPPRVEVV